MDKKDDVIRTKTERNWEILFIQKNDCIVTLLIKKLITNKIKEHLFKVPTFRKKNKKKHRSRSGVATPWFNVKSIVVKKYTG